MDMTVLLTSVVIIEMYSKKIIINRKKTSFFLKNQQLFIQFNLKKISYNKRVNRTLTS